jgi:hypothetical protein
MAELALKEEAGAVERARRARTASAAARNAGMHIRGHKRATAAFEVKVAVALLLKGWARERHTGPAS